jgi:hypothetical protein
MSEKNPLDWTSGRHAAQLTRINHEAFSVPFENGGVY